MLLICPIAGVGSRLRPLTNEKSKSQIQFAGKLAIDHIMEKIEPFCSEQNELCFVLGYRGDILQKYLIDNYGSRYRLLFVNQPPYGYSGKYPLFSGLGDAINIASRYGKNRDCFIFLSDRYPQESYYQMVESCVAEGLDGVINVQIVSDPEHYGNVELDQDGRISSLVEKPKNPSSNYAISGAYYIRKTVSNRMFELLEEQSQNQMKTGKEHQFTPILNQLVKEGGKLGINLMDKKVLDFGRPSHLLESHQEILKAQYEEFQNLQDIHIVSPENNNKIFNPISIENGAQVFNSSIGPHVSIAADCKIKNCEITNSIISRNCQLSHLSLHNVIIDENTTNNSLSANSVHVRKEK